MDKVDRSDGAKQVTSLNKKNTSARANLFTSALFKFILEKNLRVRNYSIVTSEALEGHDEDCSPTRTSIALITPQYLLHRLLNYRSTFLISIRTSCFLGKENVVQLLKVIASVVNFFNGKLSILKLTAHDVVARRVHAQKDKKEHDRNRKHNWLNCEDYPP